MQGSLFKIKKTEMNYVHQIYGLFNDNENMSNLFMESHNCFKSWAKKNQYQYILWGEKECNELIDIEYPEYFEMYKKTRFPIMKCDIVRLCILDQYGGLYADLDCFPKIERMKDSGLVLTIDKTSSGTK